MKWNDYGGGKKIFLLKVIFHKNFWMRHIFLFFFLFFWSGFNSAMLVPVCLKVITDVRMPFGSGSEMQMWNIKLLIYSSCIFFFLGIIIPFFISSYYYFLNFLASKILNPYNLLTLGVFLLFWFLCFRIFILTSSVISVFFFFKI